MSDPNTDKNPELCLSKVQGLAPFKDTLAGRGLALTRGECTTLQVNVGLLCNQSCRHCHLDAGPTRPEVMNAETAAAVIRLAERFRFQTIDITGGAPEMNPHIEILLRKLAPLADTTILRSNLTAMAAARQERLVDLAAANGVTITASLPSLNETQAETQRGSKTFAASIKMLRELNGYGYGSLGSNLELNLVSNPTGAFLPSSQEQVEKRFRQVLAEKWGITFNNLYAFANVPLGRFYTWLEDSCNLENYLQKLAAQFNPCTLENLMCRSLISVSWDGFLFDCDFNQSLQLYMDGRKRHISELDELPGPGSSIGVGDHCYTCTAGSGFT